LARRARLLGLSLPEVKDLVERAFWSECGVYAQEILHLVSTQRARIDQQIAELQMLRGELDSLEQEARAVTADVPAGLTVAECGRCLLVDGESGERGFCNCTPTQQVIALESVAGGTMSEQLTPEVVDVLVCEIGQRPKGAPTIDQIVGSVTSLRREADSLVVDFDPTAAETVEAVVAAERRCCSTIHWQLNTEQGLQLRITAMPLQLATLEEMFGAQPVS